MSRAEEPTEWTTVNGIEVPSPASYPCIGYGPNKTVWACQSAELQMLIGTYDDAGKITYNTAATVAEQRNK